MSSETVHCQTIQLDPAGLFLIEIDVPCEKYLETEKYVHDLERIFFWSLSRMRIEKFRPLYVLRGDGYPVVTDLKNWLVEMIGAVDTNGP
jgi:hypothetical protein